jgi:lipoprotein-anchoring transpeptidase ErfK/SrfK
MSNTAQTFAGRCRDRGLGAAMRLGRLGQAGRLSQIASVLALAAMLGACSASMGTQPELAATNQRFSPDVLRRYAALTDEPFPVAAISQTDLKPDYVRRVVDYETHEQPGTLIVDPHHRYLYLVMEGGQAMRYGVGVGKAGMEFTGSAIVGRKANWPRWTPTPDMLRREPERNGRWAGGMAGGVGNPLGARALYLFKNGQDTLYRIHGTVEPWSIGEAVSSGCIRMLNQDVIDLHRRVPVGARVVVLGAEGAVADRQGEAASLAALPPRRSMQDVDEPSGDDVL